MNVATTKLAPSLLLAGSLIVCAASAQGAGETSVVKSGSNELQVRIVDLEASLAESEAQRTKLRRLLDLARADVTRQVRFRRALERELTRLRSASKRDCVNVYAVTRYREHANLPRRTDGDCE